MKRPNLTRARQRFAALLESAETVEPEYTGRFIITFRDGAVEDGRRLLEAAGLVIANADDVTEGVLREDQAEGADVLILPRVGMALLSGEPGQFELVSSLDPEHTRILFVNPETVVSLASDRTARLVEYVRGYSDAAALLASAVKEAHAAPELFFDVARESNFVEQEFTWGIQATRAHTSRFDGNGIRLAILDSGLDLNHRDFASRTTPQQRQSFIWGEASVQDIRGHGTHCAGIACGPQRPAEGPRYGVASRSELFIGKVVNDAGIGAKASVIEGIDWAIKNRCQVISMSIEQKVFRGVGFDEEYELAARRAFDTSLLIASAGNFSNRRNNFVMPVSAPANCPSIMAVGSIGREMRVSNFSNGGINPNGGEVNIVAPGESIHSSFPPNTYLRDSGTSMATPFVAGIAALLAQANPSARGQQLRSLLIQSAQAIGAQSEDAGVGLVLTPQ